VTDSIVLSDETWVKELKVFIDAHLSAEIAEMENLKEMQYHDFPLKLKACYLGN
jgi:hypothetical protein